MKKKAAKRCKCGHVEVNHQHRDKTVEQMLQQAIQSRLIEPIPDPTRMCDLGYKPLNPSLVDINRVWLPDEMLKFFAKVRDESSSCRGMMFQMCSCKMYQMDNLKYLEELDEHSTR